MSRLATSIGSLNVAWNVSGPTGRVDPSAIDQAVTFGPTVSRTNDVANGVSDPPRRLTTPLPTVTVWVPSPVTVGR